jgi:hypothetical protein
MKPPTIYRKKNFIDGGFRGRFLVGIGTSSGSVIKKIKKLNASLTLPGGTRSLAWLYLAKPDGTKMPNKVPDHTKSCQAKDAFLFQKGWKWLPSSTRQYQATPKNLHKDIPARPKPKKSIRWRPRGGIDKSKKRKYFPSRGGIAGGYTEVFF